MAATDGYGVVPLTRLLPIALGLGIVAPGGSAQAAMKIEGNFRSINMSVADVERRTVLDAIARRYRIKVTGALQAGAEPVSGRFRGDVGDVLARILMSNNFLIVYEGGRPARLLLSERGQSSTPVDPSMRVLQQGGGNALGGGQFIDPGAQGPNGEFTGQPMVEGEGGVFYGDPAMQAAGEQPMIDGDGGVIYPDPAQNPGLYPAEPPPPEQGF